MKLVPKGVLKALILKDLENGPKHGYEIMKDVERLTSFWKPSPGTVYPLLRSMKRENLIGLRIKRNKKIYFLKKKGKEYLEKIETVRLSLRNEMIKKLSKIFDVNEQQLRSVMCLWRKRVPEEVKMKILDIVRLCIAAKRKRKVQKVLSVLDECIDRLSNI